MFKKLNSKQIYQDKWLEFFQDEIEFPDGSKGTYAWAKRKNGVGIVVTTNFKEILLHREYRYVIDAYSWEVQGGGIDKGEEPIESAIRELKEESGISVHRESVKFLGEFYPLHSFNTEKVTLFMVTVNKSDIQDTNTEVSESIDQHKFVSFDEALRMIDTGEINDAMTANAIQIAIRKSN